MRRPIPFLVVGILFFLCSQADARLDWESRRIKLKAGPTDSRVSADFKFKNSGKTTVLIKSVKADCSCTVPNLEKKEYLPGEKGKITATFTIGQRLGLQKKEIAVETDDPKNPMTVLTLETDIPQLLEITPSLLFWETGQVPSAKTVDIRVLTRLPIRVVSVSSEESLIVPHLITVRDGRRYKLEVRPSDVSTPIRGFITIKTDFPPENPRLFYVNAFVKPEASRDSLHKE